MRRENRGSFALAEFDRSKGAEIFRYSLYSGGVFVYNIL